MFMSRGLSLCADAFFPSKPVTSSLGALKLSGSSTARFPCVLMPSRVVDFCSPKYDCRLKPPASKHAGKRLSGGEKKKLDDNMAAILQAFALALHCSPAQEEIKLTQDKLRVQRVRSLAVSHPRCWNQSRGQWGISARWDGSRRGSIGPAHVLLLHFHPWRRLI